MPVNVQWAGDMAVGKKNSNSASSTSFILMGNTTWKQIIVKINIYYN